MTADEEAYKHFKDTLIADLRQNVKPVIISLTMLAEDYKPYSHLIAKSIDEYIRQVSPDLKLLGLYLMDSIMKNLKATTNYIGLFEKNVVPLFTHVFECVDEQNRKAMYKLRQTWNDIFSIKLLYDIDVSVKRIDHAWPITANLNPTANNTTNNNPNKPTNVQTASSSSSTLSINTSQISQNQQLAQALNKIPTNIIANTNATSLIMALATVNSNQFKTQNNNVTNNVSNTTNTPSTNLTNPTVQEVLIDLFKLTHSKLQLSSSSSSSLSSSTVMISLLSLWLFNLIYNQMAFNNAIVCLNKIIITNFKKSSGSYFIN